MSDLVERLEIPWSRITGTHANSVPKKIDAILKERREAAQRIRELEADLGKAVEVLGPFADIFGEGDEDFADDTPVPVKFGRTTHYALKLADLRRATALHAELSARLSGGGDPTTI